MDDLSGKINMDPDTLYREEVFTDRQMGTIMRMTPVTADGERDENRPVIYVGQSQIYTPAGALPLSFEIEASSLREAAEKFGPAAEKSAEETIERLKEMRREAASSIVVPGQESAGGMGGMPGGGMPGSGKIQLK